MHSYQLQIRSYNELAKSDWSDPVVLAKYPDLDPLCNGSSIPTSSNTGKQSTSDHLSYYVHQHKVTIIHVYNVHISVVISTETTTPSMGTIPAYILGGIIASLVGLIIICILVAMASVLCHQNRRRKRYLKSFKVHMVTTKQQYNYQDTTV